jgi:site-specific recombinase
MEDLDKKDLIQLVNFYRQKASDADLELLKLQLKYNKLNSVILNSVQEPTKKSK